MLPQVVCFGETLFDVLPDGRHPGGAPMNVAVHLRQLGVSAAIISRMGTDEPGAALLDFLKSRNVETSGIQSDERYPTGLVMADVSNPSEIRYDIVYPSAWDFIEVTPAAQAWVSAAEVMVFGSLVARSSVSASSLLRLVDAARYPVLDINLRAPHYTREILEQLMSRARMVKLNEHELALIASWYTDENDDRIQMAVLQEKYKWDTLCVTLGGDGAWLRTKSTLYRQTGFKVTVADTIGSGDSFLAALLHHRLAGKPDHEALRFACGVGALIASRKGATPDWTQEDVYALIRSQQGDPV